MNFVYAYLRAPPGGTIGYLEFVDEAGAADGKTPAFSRWSALSAPLRKTDRFKAYIRKVGVVDYWRTKGRPDACHPITGDDFVCV